MRAWPSISILGAATGLTLGLGCTASPVFICGSDEDCDDGRCEPTGYCSFPSENCDGGWAYGELSAPQLAGECIDEATTTDVTDTEPGDASTGGPPVSSTTDDSVDASDSVDPTTSTSTTSTTDRPVTTEPATSDSGTCPDRDQPMLIWAEQMLIVPPMELGEAGILPMNPAYAFSTQEEDGMAIAEVFIDCDLEILAWGLVLDAQPGGFANDDPDSFYLSLDGSPELLWEYGCAFSKNDGPWKWVPIGLDGMCPADPEPIPVTAGVHALQIRNSEPAVEGLTAGIAAVFVTTDPGAHPDDVYPVGPL